MISEVYDPQIMELIGLGDFGPAAVALGHDWRGPGVMPEREGRNDAEYAAALLFCGLLTLELGLMGSPLQGAAKDMLSTSARLYGDNLEGSQIARAGLCTAYERSGEFPEAIALADSILAEEPGLDVTVCVAKSKAISQNKLGDPRAALNTLDSVAGLVPATTMLTQGKYHLQRGVTNRNLQLLDDAVSEYQIAAEQFEGVKSARYEAVASNNLAGVCTDRGQFLLAHVLIERAIRLFAKIGDSNHEGMAWDQQAQAFLKEGKALEAERASQRAVALLEAGDHSDFLAEALMTRGKARVEIATKGIACFHEGLDDLQRAVSIHEQHGNPRLAAGAHRQLLTSFLRARDASESVIESAKDAEHTVIEHLLSEHEGRMAKPAIALRMHHSSLQQRLKAHFPDLLQNRRPPKKRHKRLFRQS